MPRHPSVFERDEFSVEIRGEAITEVTVRKEVRRYLELRQQAKRSSDALK